jgi:ketosteroid isomerase-like protein
MSVARNIAIVRRFYAAGPADDDAERAGSFAADAVWHVPGDNPVSGAYRGVAAIRADMPARMAPLDEWAIEPIEVMGNADLVMATVRLRARRRGHALDTTGGHVFRLDEAGRIVEAWGFVARQAELDELFRA